MTDPDIDGLMNRLAQVNVKAGTLPPVNDWHPSRKYRIKIRIDRDGRWYYQDSEIRRESMVRLFASILRYDDDGYYLVTPQEKLLIQVDCLPLVAIRVEQTEHPDRLIFTINTGEMVAASAAHPLSVTEKKGEPEPVIHVRDRLHALIHRNVFYQLVNMAYSEKRAGGNHLLVFSEGKTFDLGGF
jgi:hypothetical protein